MPHYTFVMICNSPGQREVCQHVSLMNDFTDRFALQGRGCAAGDNNTYKGHTVWEAFTLMDINPYVNETLAGFQRHIGAQVKGFCPGAGVR